MGDKTDKVNIDYTWFPSMDLNFFFWEKWETSQFFLTFNKVRILTA